MCKNEKKNYFSVTDCIYSRSWIIQFEEYIQKYANEKLYMRDEFYQQYTAEIMEMYDVPGM